MNKTLPWLFRKGGKVKHAEHDIEILGVDGDEISIRDNGSEYIISRQGLERFLNNPNPFPKKPKAHE